MAKNELDLQMEDYQYLPLRDVVFRTLRQAILRGELKPGERLMEIRLANQLGVSRTPIREAIRMLELDGLVIMVPRKGAQVAQITEKDLNDVLEVRLGLEELAVKLACQRITESELQKQKSLFRGIPEQLPVRRFNSLPWSFIIITKILSLRPNRVSHFRRHTVKNQIEITVIQKIPRFQCFPFLNKPNIIRTSISVLPTVSSLSMHQP